MFRLVGFVPKEIFVAQKQSKTFCIMDMVFLGFFLALILEVLKVKNLPAECTTDKPCCDVLSLKRSLLD